VSELLIEPMRYCARVVAQVPLGIGVAAEKHDSAVVCDENRAAKQRADRLRACSDRRFAPARRGA
jgi:hypothetical protein